jgi:hypothetical protein
MRWWLLCLVTLAACKEQRDESWGAGQGPATAVAAARDAAASDGGAAPGDGAVDAAPLAAPPTEAELDAALGKALDMARALGDIGAKHGEDCGALATAIDELISTNRPLFEELARYGADEATAARTQRWMAAHASDLDGAIARARPALERCRNDARIKAAFERLSRWP